MSRIFTDSRGLNDVIDNAFEAACLIYRPGSSFTGPILYNDWDDLMVAKTALATEGILCPSIGMDDTDVDPSRITFPSGVYDLTGSEIYHARGVGTSGFVFLDTTGAQFTQVRRMSGLQIRHNSSTIPFNYPGGGLVRFENTLLFNDGASAATPAIGGFGSGEFLAIRGTITFSDDSGIVCEVVAGATLSMAFGFQEIGADTVGGAGLWIAGPLNDAFFNADQPNFSGTYLPFNFSMNYVDLPAVATAAKAATALARPTAKHRYDTSGGVITQPLPPALGRPGYVIEFHRDGASALDLARDGSDTIDGVAGSYTVADGSTVRLISDGATDWDVTVLE